MRGNDKLREELGQRGLKPSDLARRLGMDRKIVRDVLRGAQDVRLRDIANIARALGFKADLVLESVTVLDAIADPREARRPRRARVKWL